MSEIKVNKISPATGTAITLGDSGDTLTVPSGGTIVNSGTATGFGGGSWTKIKTITASSDSTIEFIDGTASVVFDNTYKKYRIEVIDMHCSAAEYLFVNFTTDGGSNWNVSKANKPIVHWWREDGGSYANYPTIVSASDQHTGTTTGGKLTADEVQGIDATDSLVGELMIWNPSGTTYHKWYHWYGQWIGADTTEHISSCNAEGKLETTSAVDGVQFAMGSGNIDAGTFILYGLT